MKLKKIILMVCAILIISSGVIVFAAYTYTRKNSISAKSGEISIESEKYLSYALNEGVERGKFSVSEYKAILKERAGATAVDITGVTDFVSEVGEYSYYYEKEVKEASDSFDKDTLYYIKDDIDTYILQENLDSFEVGVTYYTITYSKASASPCYRLGHKVVSDVSETNINAYYILDSVDKQGYGVFKQAEEYNADTTYFEIVYAPSYTTTNGTIDSSQTGSEAISCINTYATERKITSTEENYIYLNQLGFRFEVKTNIKAYVRIKFFDAWQSSKLYSGQVNAKRQYIQKGQISGRSPFYVDNENWYYDSSTNVCYLKATIDPKDDSYIYTFNINDSYFYTQNTTTSYTENILVQVSYSLELIQANRAEAVWGVDPSKLGSGN